MRQCQQHPTKEVSTSGSLREGALSAPPLGHAEPWGCRGHILGDPPAEQRAANIIFYHPRLVQQEIQWCNTSKRIHHLARQQNNYYCFFQARCGDRDHAPELGEGDSTSWSPLAPCHKAWAPWGAFGCHPWCSYNSTTSPKQGEKAEGRDATSAGTCASPKRSGSGVPGCSTMRVSVSSGTSLVCLAARAPVTLSCPALQSGLGARLQLLHKTQLGTRARRPEWH